MKKIVGLKEFRQNVDTWIKHVNHGHSLVVFRRSQPVFKISPVSEGDWEEIIDFTQIKQGGVDIKELLARL